MESHLRAAIVRILNSSGNTAGTGFVVTDDGLIATCAHVIQSEVAQRQDSPRPDFVEVVFRDENQSRRARVTEEWWEPTKDVAILKLEGDLPTDVSPLPVGTSTNSRGHEFNSWGFRHVSEFSDSLGTKGEIQGLTARRGRRVQEDIEVLQLWTDQIDIGMSGAPVWDVLARRVVGIVTSRWRTEDHVDTRLAFAIPSETLTSVCKRLEASDLCPYKGLDAFAEVDAPYFFGRQRLVNTLLAKLRESPRFLMLVGRSGSGKTSVIQAGLLPALREGKGPGGTSIHVLSFRPGSDPFAEISAVESATDHDLKSTIQYLLDTHECERIVLFIDQFEELFALSPSQDQKRFLDGLLELLDSNIPVTAILNVRADFYGRFLEERWTEWLTLGQVNVPPMTTEELHEAVEAPADKVGLRFQEGLVSTIVEDAEKITENAEEEKYPLPLLEFALAQLWEQRQEGELTHDAYRNIGGVAGAVSQWAEDAYAAFNPKSRETVRRVLTRLIHYGSETKSDSRRWQTLDVLIADLSEKDKVRSIIRKLAGERLIVTDRDPRTDVERFEIVHDALLWNWGRLKQWRGEEREKEREFLRWRQQLQATVETWEHSGRDTGHLLTREPLKRAVNWLESRPEDLSPDERAFINASIDLQKKQRRQMLIGSVLVVIIVIGLILLARSLSERAQGAETGATAQAIERATAQAEVTIQAQNRVTAEVGATAEAIERVTAVANEATAQAQQALAQSERDRQELISTAGELANQSQISLGRRPQRSLLLAIEAINVTLAEDGTYTRPAEEAIRQALANVSGMSLEAHRSEITAMAVSPDNRWMVTSSADGELRIWNLQTSDLRPGYVNTYLNAGAATLLISPDSRWLVIGTRARSAYLLDLTSADPLASYVTLFDETCPGYDQGYKCPIDIVNFSNDSQWLAIYHEGGGEYISERNTWEPDPLHLYDLSQNPITNTVDIVFDGESGALEYFDTIGTGSGTFHAIAFSPDNQNLAVGYDFGNDTRVMLLDLTSEEPQVTVGTEEYDLDFVSALAFSSDERWLFSGTQKGVARLWDLTSEEPLSRPITLSGFEEVTISDAAFTPDNRWIIAAGFNGTAKLWSLTTQTPGEMSVLLEDHDNRINDIVVTTNSESLITASEDHTIRIWDLQDKLGNSEILPGHDTPVNSLAITRDDRLLFSGGKGGAIRMWRLEDATHSPFPKILIEGDSPVRRVAISDDDKWIAAGNREGLVFLWKSEDLEAADILYGHHSAIQDILFSPDSNWLVTASADDTVRLWDLTSDNIASTQIVLREHTQDVNALAITSDSHWLATAGGDDVVRMWDLTSTDIVRSAFELQGHDSLGEIAAVDFSPDGHWIASGSSDETTRLWDLRKENPATNPIVLPGHDLGVRDVAFSPDSRWLATSGNDDTPFLWDLNNLTDPFPLQGHFGTVSTLAFSHDSRWLATAGGPNDLPGGDGTIKLWDLNESGPRVPAYTLEHSDWVLTTAFSPDDRWLVSASADHNIYFWDLTAPTDNPRIFSGHKEWVNSIAISSDGDWLVSGAGDGSVGFWPLRIDRLIELACVAVGRNLTWEEWSQFFADEPYHLTCPGHSMHSSVLRAVPVPNFENVLLQDDFSSEESGLTSYASGGWGERGYISPVGYRFDLAPNTGPIFDYYSELRLPKNFKIEVTCGYEGAADSSYGIVFQLTEPDQFHAFLISGTGFFAVARFENGNGTLLGEWIPSNLISQEEQEFNKIAVLGAGRTYSFYINGQFVATFSDLPYEESNPGLIVGNYDQIDSTGFVCYDYIVSSPNTDPKELNYKPRWIEP